MPTPQVHLFDRTLLRQCVPIAPTSKVLDLGFHDPDGAIWAATAGASVVALRPAVDLATALEEQARTRGVKIDTRLETTILPDEHGAFSDVLLVAPFYLGNGSVRAAMTVAAIALGPSGHLYFQAHRRHGSDTFQRMALELFADVTQMGIGIGQCRLFRASRPRPRTTDTAPAVITGTPEHAVTVRSTTVQIRLGIGVFGARGIDPATTLLLEVAEVGVDHSVLDLGCGAGPIGILLGAEERRRRVTMADVSRPAVDLARENAIRNGLTRARVILSDGFAAMANDRFDAILSNLPAHSGHLEDPALGGRLIAESARFLAPNGTAWFVVARARPIEIEASRAYRIVEVVRQNGRYKVVKCAGPRLTRSANRNTVQPQQRPYTGGR